MSCIRSAWTWSVLACLVGALGLASGCGREKPNVNSPPPKNVNLAPPTPETPDPNSPELVLPKLPGGAEFEAGKKVYAKHVCARCHKLGDVGGATGDVVPPPPDKSLPRGGPEGHAPDLTKVGAAPEHTKQWLADHVRNPKKHTPDSRMPVYSSEYVSDGDLANLVEYLASRK
jgi:mono/diheme cytochrome c family protein